MVSARLSSYLFFQTLYFCIVYFDSGALIVYLDSGALIVYLDSGALIVYLDSGALIVCLFWSTYRVS